MNCLALGPESKTNFLLRRAQAFERLTIIDPRGDLASAFADTTHRDAIYFQPAKTERPLGLNILEPGPEKVCQLFEMLWPHGWGAQSDWILANCLAVIPQKDTLLGVLKILSDMSYRAECLSSCKDPVVLANWRILDDWDDKQFAAATAPVLNKVGRLLMSPLRRNILCQEFTSLRGDVVVADLSGLDRLSARLFGYLLMHREGHIIINDLGFFSTKKSETDEYLPLADCTVTVDFLRQLTPTLEDAVLAFPEKAVTPTTRHDAEELMFYLGLGNASALMTPDLGIDQIRTLDGIEAPATLPSLGRKTALENYTQSQFARHRSQVEGNIYLFLNGGPSAR